MMRKITLSAPAKINLTLDVLGSRPDGYHQIETIMQTISLADGVRITAEPGGGIDVTCAAGREWGAERLPPAGPGNLAHRAAVVLAGVTGGRQGAAIVIEKHIPMAAGLGGGSADAAAVLWGLNRLWGALLSGPELERLGAELGSDVPFCLRGGTVLGRGRGEELEELPDLPSAWVVLVNPRLSLSTAQVYRVWNRRADADLSSAKFLEAQKAGGLARAAGAMANGLEAAAFSLCPEVKAILDRLRRAKGILGACLSGSGPTVFGLAAEKAAAEKAAAEFAAAGHWTRLARTLNRKER